VFVDASAIVAIVANEKEASALLARLDQASECFTSPIAIYEASLGLSRLLRLPLDDAQRLAGNLLKGKNAATVPITAKTGEIALDAFARFGKGRHPAALNMGDCFAYACAKELKVPLLFKGNDFAQTDIEPA
jgi:ribonuclease VapC